MADLNKNVCEKLEKAHSILISFIPFAETAAFRMYRNIRYLNREEFDRSIESVMTLGNLYHKRHKYMEAFELYGIAAEAGDARALRKLGQYYFNGNGVQVNYALAFANFQAAAMKHDDISIEMLGRCYDTGLGCPQSYISAKCKYDISALDNKVYSIKRLGDFYRYGLGVEQDGFKAVQYYRQGAKLNHRGCLIALADCYRNGIGVDCRQPIYALWLRFKAEFMETS